MAIYWVTFRIAEQGDASARYQKLTDHIRDLADGIWWTEPTSFVVFKNNMNIDQVAMHLASAINKDLDLVLIGMPDYKDGRLIGASHDSDLFKLMPFIKKL